MNRYVEANIVFSKFSRDYMELKRELPVRPSEMAVLNIITQRGERYTPREIADLLGVSKPMVAAHVAKLAKLGYITREPSDADKRSFFVLPTEKATALAKSFNRRQEEHLRAIEAGLGEERFTALLTLLAEAESVLKKTKEK